MGEKKEEEGTRYTYDREGHLLALFHPEQGEEEFCYDAVGNRICHRKGEQGGEKEGILYQYDEEDRLCLVQEEGGEILARYVYDPKGNCICQEDSFGGLHYYRYDLAGNCIGQLDQVEGEEGSRECVFRKTTYGYDRNHNCIQEIRHGGRYTKEGGLQAKGEDLVLTYTYDERNRRIRAEDGRGACITYGYDARDNCTRIEQVIQRGTPEEEGEEKGKGKGKEALLRILQYTYDRAGRRREKRELLDGGIPGEEKQWAITTYGYDSNGNLTRVQTPEGYEILCQYDERDRLQEECRKDLENGLLLTTVFSYDPAGNVMEVVQKGGEGTKRITYAYDKKNRLKRVHQWEGPQFTYTYDGKDQVREERRRLPGEKEQYGSTLFSYDPRGNLVQTLRGEEQLEKWRYEKRGRRVWHQDGDQVLVSYSYGWDGQLRSIAGEGARRKGTVSEERSYDPWGRLVGIRKPEGGRTERILDPWGRVERIRTPEGGEEVHTYDAAGNRRTIRDGLGRVTTYTYTSRGQVASREDPLGQRELFFYDREGRCIRHVDGRGTVTQTRYNMYGRAVFQSCTDAKGRRQVTGRWVYDDFGHLKEAKTGGVTYTYRYRPDGKLLEKSRNGRQVLRCSYYPEGSLKSLTDEGGRRILYTYDRQGRLETIGTGEGKVLLRYTYTKGGRLASQRGAQGIQSRYSYDLEGQICRLQIEGREGRVLYDSALTYDLRGNCVRKEGRRWGRRKDGEAFRITYGYDGRNRLVREERAGGGSTRGEEYAYDRLGNRLQKTSYHYEALFGEAGTGETGKIIDEIEEYCYNEGNQLLWRRKKGETTAYTYDGNGSVLEERRERTGKETEVTRYQYDLLNRPEAVVLPTGEHITYGYNGEGLRDRITKEGKESSFFLYHEGDLLLEEREEGALCRYVYGHGLGFLETGEEVLFCHRNEQGSTLYLTGEKGRLRNAYRYDGFGAALETREEVKQRICYTGQIREEETEQYYLRARYYHPALGRFLQEDSYREESRNLYVYCENNPVRYFDPSGHRAIPHPNQADAPYPSTGTGRVDGIESGTSSGNLLPMNLQFFASKSGSKAINNVSQASPFDLQATHSQMLSKKNMNKLIDDIKNNGINETIKYVEYNGQKYVVDGHHRLIASKRLGLEQVPIEQVELPYAGYKTVEDLLWFD